MSGLVCKVFILRRFTEAGYALTPEGRAAKLAELAETRRQAGARLLVNAAATWSHYDMDRFGAEVFTGIESLKKYTAALDKIDWFRYVESETFIGTPLILNEPTYENPIYVLQLIRGIREAGYTLTESDRERRFRQIIASADSLGVRRILRMTCRWSREDYGMVQVHEWPNLEALMQQVAFEQEMEWPRYFDQENILGVKTP